MTKENFHAGHRERMIARVLSQPKVLHDHELLEVLLYSAIPRVDTNETAHRLLDTFGELDQVFSATAEELMVVTGIGRRAAAHIVLAGRLLKEINERKRTNEKPTVFSFDRNKDEIVKNFVGAKDETLLIYLLDEKRRKITKVIFESKVFGHIYYDPTKLAEIIAINKPRYAIVAHNHPSGISKPSKTDYEATNKLYLLLSLHGVLLLDHVIVTEDKSYSFFLNGEIDDIKRDLTLEKLLQSQKDSLLTLENEKEMEDE